jgi:hypothetical protein
MQRRTDSDKDTQQLGQGSKGVTGGAGRRVTVCAAQSPGNQTQRISPSQRGGNFAKWRNSGASVASFDNPGLDNPPRHAGRLHLRDGLARRARQRPSWDHDDDPWSVRLFRPPLYRLRHRPARPALIQINPREVCVLQKPNAQELKPWERAPTTGYYQLLNGFGRPTGESAFVHRGNLLPSAPRPLRWRLMDSAQDGRVA